jgi:uncharacterized membrane protein
MQGSARRIVYVTLYEVIAIVASSAAMALLYGVTPLHAGVLSVVTSAIAVAWNLAFNMAFEAWESRQVRRGRSLARRIGHALGFEGGLALLLVPLIAWWLGISLRDALVLDIGLLAFFLVYTFLFNLGFDRVFGLPAAAAGSRQPS